VEAKKWEWKDWVVYLYGIFIQIQDPIFTKMQENRYPAAEPKTKLKNEIPYTIPEMQLERMVYSKSVKVIVNVIIFSGT
jgi:hypothetical protein